MKRLPQIEHNSSSSVSKKLQKQYVGHFSKDTVRNFTAQSSYSEVRMKRKNNLSFPELQRQWSSQTLFQILTTDATIDACHMLLSLQKYQKTEQRFLQ